MALTVEKLLTDARLLVMRLKEQDSTADTLVTDAQTLHKRIDAMKQYQDDITELNQIARHRPRSTLVLGIAQENRQIRELQKENHDLRLSLEEHQSALELIMRKYREQIVHLVQSNNLSTALMKNGESSMELIHAANKVSEMTAVMQKAVAIDDAAMFKDQEIIAQLNTENKCLRELLEVCSTAKNKIISDTEEKESQTDDNT